MVRKWPNSPLRGRVLFIGALATAERGDHEQAARSLQSCVEREPDGPLAVQAHLHLARCQQQLQKATDRLRAVHKRLAWLGEGWS